MSLFGSVLAGEWWAGKVAAKDRRQAKISVDAESQSSGWSWSPDSRKSGKMRNMVSDRDIGWKQTTTEGDDLGRFRGPGAIMQASAGFDDPKARLKLNAGNRLTKTKELDNGGSG